MQIRSDSTEYATATLTTDRDLTGKVIEVALPAAGTDPATYYPAQVVGVKDNGNGTWTATYRLLLGPSGDVTLPDGNYDWIVKLTDTPEVPVRKAGTVTVT